MSGSVRLRIAGYRTVEVGAGDGVVLSSRVWARTVGGEGRSLALCYRAEPSARNARLVRNGTSSMLVRAGYAPPAPGVGPWQAQQEKHKEKAKAEEKMRRGVTRDELKPPPAPWVPSNQPMAPKEDVARRHAKAEAQTAPGGTLLAKDGGASASRRIKPQLPPRRPGGA